MINYVLRDIQIDYAIQTLMFLKCYNITHIYINEVWTGSDLRYFDRRGTHINCIILILINNMCIHTIIFKQL